jgi:hypothetical protein
MEGAAKPASRHGTYRLLPGARAFRKGFTMRRLFAAAMFFTSAGVILGFSLRGGAPTVLAVGVGAGVEKCAAKNGDVNGDGNIDLSDAVSVLGNLFLGNPPQLPPLCASSPAATALPETGQDVCYGQAAGANWIEVPCGEAIVHGQDGSYATGCPPEGRFVDNGDGTVTGTCTALMWERDTGNDARRLFWWDALGYCERLNFAGHDDWRLPNVRELLSLVDYGISGPGVQPAIDRVFNGFPGYYWSSTSLAKFPSNAWSVSREEQQLLCPRRAQCTMMLSRYPQFSPGFP